MDFRQQKISRRQMLKMTGLAGLSGIALPISVRTAMAADGEAPPEPKLPQVPRRVLGKTKQEIPILLLGGAMNFDQKFDPRFAEALRFGVNYFDVADCYAGGTSEIAVGGFLDRSGLRKDLWITTKSCSHDTEGLERVFHVSLGRMKTDHVDLLFLHGLKDEKFLSPELARTADRLKKEGKIRFFGFSCHDGTAAQLLAKAATLPWIDAVMFKYNFREFGNKELNDSMDACHKADVGMIATKTMGSAVSFDDQVKKFEGGKFTHEQAALKAVWDDPRLTAAVSHMDTFEKMKANIAAALDLSKLSASDHASLQRQAQDTAYLYCAG